MNISLFANSKPIFVMERNIFEWKKFSFVFLYTVIKNVYIASIYAMAKKM